ncbi:signal transduction histidine kinase [Dyadobacter sp. BE34]|uniref:histidine kinase n=1 Tax=Dyadobacter fermentans TaxID=94254 RepID=A0ABU1QV83_9BACT|nr:MULTISPECIES: ATP-binding protein [Dyadobacter]MDR6804665.1 signal transduction histidine kinase [Dyadobacter fermentans]MDR7043576.1 signal transduction histidine kinase [Dyadobacter sp. BE242]MDR7197888.1 signal transduction histidine kinase [Dyadobacter sp. BE34]MDR7214679.1 signal transduction histidine kinase [Dyadobacter sp. BE31]MDR7262214.1 signal transduction histidine kinase [Dyadobacter sp. BE32]
MTKKVLALFLPGTSGKIRHIVKLHKMKVLHLVLITCYTHPCLSQKNKLIISQYTTDHGLPQNSVKFIAFDKWGFCWLSTEMGLVRYDGRSFTTFGKSEIKGLRSARMRILNRDQNGALYVRGEYDKVVQVKPAMSLAIPSPQLMMENSVFVPRQGLAITNQPRLNALKQFYLSNPEAKNLFTAALSDGTMYFFSSETVLYWGNDGMAPRPLQTHSAAERNEHMLLDDNVFVSVKAGNIVEAWDHGQLIEGVKAIKGPLALESAFLQGNFITFANESGAFVYVDNNLYQLTFRNGEIASKKVLEGIAIPALSSVFYEKSQNKYYMGSSIQGLFIVEKASFKHPEVSSPASGKSFYAQAKINDTTVICNDLVLSPGNKTTSANLHQDPFSAVDVSTAGQMLFQRTKNRRLIRYDLGSRKLTDLRSTSDLMVFVKADNPSARSYTFFTEQGYGKVHNDSLIKSQAFPGSAKIMAVTPLSGNLYLVGTEDGMKWYDAEKNTVYKSVLDSVQVRAIFLDNAERIWIGTYGNGFYLLIKNRLYKMPYGSQKALSTVHSFIDDGQGFFWIPTNNGLFKVRKDDLVQYALAKQKDVPFFRFDRGNGLATNEFNGACRPTHVWLKDSLLSISSLEGIEWFYPNKLHPNYPNRPIFVDSLKVNNIPAEFRNNRIRLGPDFTSVALTASSPYFGHAANLNLEYMLQGFDSHWHSLGENGTLTINGLPAGDYNLVLRRASYTPGNPHFQLSVPLSVDPWFYNTWWFRTVTGLGLFFLSYLLVKRRLNLLRKKSEELENTVENRTIELHRAIEDLARSEHALTQSNRFKDQVLTMILHDLRSPIKFISVLSGKIYENHDNFSRDELHVLLSDLLTGTQTLLGFSEDFFLWIASQQEGFKVNKGWFSLQSLFDEIAALYDKIVEVNKNELVIQPTHLDCYTDYQILSIIIRNLIDNANKHTTSGTIAVAARYQNENLSITVKDSGRGLDSRQITAFLSREKSFRNNGTGSILILTMLDRIGGTITINSQIDKGSAFTIHFPAPPKSGIAAQDG